MSRTAPRLLVAAVYFLALTPTLHGCKRAISPQMPAESPNFSSAVLVTSAADEEPSELEQTVRRLAAIQPDQESIDYLATIDPRTGRPKGQRTRSARLPKDDQGRPLPAVVAQLGREYPLDRAGAIYHMVLSADGRVVATGHCSGIVQLFDGASGRPIRQLRPDRGHLTSIAFSPDGKTLATAGGGWRQAEPSGIHLWDVASGRELPGLWPPAQSRAMAFAPDGKSLAGVGWDNEIRIWDPANGRKIRSFPADKASMLTFTPDGTKLAAAGDGWVTIYDPTTGKNLKHLRLDGGTFGAFVVVAPDGRRLAMGNQAKTQIYDLEADKVLAANLPGARRVTPYRSGVPVAFSPDNKTVASADSVIHLFDAASGQQRSQLRGSRAATLAYAPNGKTLISGDESGNVLIWDVTHRALENHPRAVAFSARELDALGRDLESADAVWAYNALLTLGAAPRETLWLYREGMDRPVEASPERVNRLIADLDSPRFEARQRAGAELTRLGDWSVAPLRRALADNPPLETKQRIERLLEDLDPALPNADRLLALHAVDLLEVIGTPEARKVLERLAAGPAANRVTVEAKEALKRRP